MDFITGLPPSIGLDNRIYDAILVIVRSTLAEATNTGSTMTMPKQEAIGGVLGSIKLQPAELSHLKELRPPCYISSVNRSAHIGDRSVHIGDRSADADSPKLIVFLVAQSWLMHDLVSQSCIALEWLPALAVSDSKLLGFRLPLIAIA